MTFLGDGETGAIGPFRIVRLLGEGGMGRVYLATSASGRAVAVKVVRPELAGDPSFRRRFRAEVEAAMAVSGAFTTPVVDADPDGPVPWLATVYVPGPSLQSEIETRGPMAEAQVRALGARLAEALAAIHRAGIIHRDLKPSNILLADDGPRVIDFGISRAADGTSLTATGGVIGSAGYMSPEQVAGHELTPASDVFALGAVVAFAATGRSAFGTGPFQVVMFRAAYESPWLDGTPPGLVGLVSACLDKDPRRRPKVARLPELFVAPSPALPPEPARSPPEPTKVLSPSPNRRQLILGGAAVVAVAGGSAAVLAVLGKGRSTERVQPTGSPSGSPGAQPIWTRTVSGEHGDLAVLGEMILCLDKAGIDTFALKDGTPIWKGETNHAGYFPKLRGKRIYLLGDEKSINAYDPRIGDVLWISELRDGEPEGTYPAGSVLVVKDTDGRLHGLDAATGRQRWSTTTPKEAPHILEGLPSRGTVLASTRAYDPPAYAAISLGNGEARWSRQGKLHAHCTDGERFYVLDPDLNLAAVDPLTGRELWSTPSRMPQYRPAADEPSYSLRLVERTLICASTAPYRIGAFDVATGRRRWPAKPATSNSWAQSGRTLAYVNKEFRASDLLTGETLWTGDTWDDSVSFHSGAGALAITETPDGLEGWDLRSGRLSWYFRHPAVETLFWSYLRAPDRLFVKYGQDLFAFDFPGTDAPAVG
ncbi:serine/threonine-protein kinase [Streptosporangium sp. NPDC049644]|uniref:serine/threonine-protein kinase n=1 Tax=Streptosporangium sp. NPDC049644 TaxID=3155507 RepID=UPI00341A198F